MSRPYLLFGSSGLLGSGYREALVRAGQPFVRLQPSWGRAGDAAAQLEAALSVQAEVVVVWAAGVGHVGVDEAAMRTETDTVRAVCDAVRSQSGPSSVSLLFASSAGAIYGGHGAGEIGEGAEPRPITSYGREKLRQEELVAALADEVGCRAVICRYTNLYGLAGGLVAPRGLVSTAVRATRLRQPMVVYVSSDTRRDLVYNVDAARESLSLLAAAQPGTTTALVCEGETRTVSEVLALVGRVSGRRVPATYAERPETRLQPRVLRFQRPRRRGAPRRTPLETGLHLMLRAPLAPPV